MSRTTVRTGLAVGVITGSLLLTGCHGGSQPAQSTGLQPTTAPASTSTTSAPTTDPVAATTISGTFLYSDPDLDSLVTLTGSRPRTVLKVPSATYTAKLSPDGRLISYLDTHRGDYPTDLMVVNVDGSHVRKLRANVVENGFEPIWSPDSRTVFTAIGEEGPGATPGTVRVSDGHFTALPAKIRGYIHYALSGDGKQYAFGDGRNNLLTARTDGTGLRRVPNFGLDSDSAGNPARLRGDVLTMDSTGARLAVDLIRGNEEDGDIAPSLEANGVIEAATGKVVPLPIHGRIRQALYLRDGNLLVRTEAGGKDVLTLVSPSLRVLATRAEPASVKKLYLIGYSG